MIRIPCPTVNTHRSIRNAKRKSASPQYSSHDDFLLMIPAIRRHAYFSFHKKRLEEKTELVEECIANAFKTYARLKETGKQDLIYPTVHSWH